MFYFRYLTLYVSNSHGSAEFSVDCVRGHGNWFQRINEWTYQNSFPRRFIVQLLPWVNLCKVFISNNSYNEYCLRMHRTSLKYDWSYSFTCGIWTCGIWTPPTRWPWLRISQRWSQGRLAVGTSFGRPDQMEPGSGEQHGSFDGFSICFEGRVCEIEAGSLWSIIAISQEVVSIILSKMARNNHIVLF